MDPVTQNVTRSWKLTAFISAHRVNAHNDHPSLPANLTAKQYDATKPHRVDSEKNTTSTEYAPYKPLMAAKARVSTLRTFLGVPSSAYKALQEEEKKEYDTWHADSREEEQARQRFGEIANSPDEVKVMIKGWRVEHPRPQVSEVVKGLLDQEATVAAPDSGAEKEAHPTTRNSLGDILEHFLVFIEKPWMPPECQICGRHTVAQPTYRLACGHGLHALCFEKQVDTWLEMKRPVTEEDGGGKECKQCEAVKRLLRKLPRKELEAQVRRMGDKFLSWRKRLR